MCKFILLILVIGIALLSFECNAQQFQLSLRNLEKLNRIENGRERILRYQKYFRRDSAKNERALRKAYRQRIDSAWRVNKTRRTMKKNGLRELKRFQGKIGGDIMPAMDSLKNISTRNHLRGDSIRFDSAVQQIEIFKRINRGHDFNLHDGIPLKDNGLPDSEHLNTGMIEKIGVDQPPDLNDPSTVFDRLQKADHFPGQPGDVNQILRKHDDVSNTIQSVRDGDVSDQLKSAATQQIDRIMPSGIISAQRKVAKLLSKYREFINSEDPASAVKRSSLKGKTLGERVHSGINFSPVSIVPICFDIAPQLGYKFNKKFFAGISLRYRVGLGDSIERRTYLSSANLGYSAFALLTLRRSIFAFAESETARTSPDQNESVGGSWRMNYFVGLGRRFLVHPKLYFNVLMLYNFVDENSNPFHPERFQCRIGVSMSELAIRKRLIHYNANR